MEKKKPFSNVLKLLIFIVLFGIITAGIDYLRMNSGEVPIFNLKKYDEKTKIQTFRGMFYKAKRKVTVSPKESLVDSSNMEYAILIFNLNVPRQFKEIVLPYKVKTKETENCQEQSKLYYADKNVKVYTYCLDNISIVRNEKEESLLSYLEKDSDFIYDIDSKLAYMGLYIDNSTLVLKDRENLSNQGLNIYHCNNNVKDFYITPANANFKADFCTPKDDDFKFMYKINDTSEPPTQIPDENDPNKKEEPQPEIFFEDSENFYQFPYLKSDKIFLETEALRGFPAKKISLKEALTNQIVTLEELKTKGLKFETVSKAAKIETSNKTEAQ